LVNKSPVGEQRGVVGVGKIQREINGSRFEGWCFVATGSKAAQAPGSHQGSAAQAQLLEKFFAVHGWKDLV
jgi:hypothetical protein